MCCWVPRDWPYPALGWAPVCLCLVRHARPPGCPLVRAPTHPHDHTHHTHHTRPHTHCIIIISQACVFSALPLPFFSFPARCASQHCRRASVLEFSLSLSPSSSLRAHPAAGTFRKKACLASSSSPPPLSIDAKSLPPCIGLLHVPHVPSTLYIFSPLLLSSSLAGPASAFPSPPPSCCLPSLAALRPCAYSPRLPRSLA